MLAVAIGCRAETTVERAVQGLGVLHADATGDGRDREVGRLEQPTASGKADIVHENVDASERGRCPVDDVPHTFRAADVGSDRQHAGGVTAGIRNCPFRFA